MRKLTGEKLEAELARLEGMRAYEHQYESAGIVCGIDEAEGKYRCEFLWSNF